MQAAGATDCTAKEEILKYLKSECVKGFKTNLYDCDCPPDSYDDKCVCNDDAPAQRAFDTWRAWQLFVATFAARTAAGQQFYPLQRAWRRLRCWPLWARQRADNREHLSEQLGLACIAADALGLQRGLRRLRGHAEWATRLAQTMRAAHA